MSDEQLALETLGTFAAANGLTACISVIGLACIGFLAVRPKTRNPGLLFAGLGFIFIALANCGFAAQGIITIVTAFQIRGPQVGQVALDLLNRMNCAFSATAMVGLVSLILAFL